MIKLNKKVISKWDIPIYGLEDKLPFGKYKNKSVNEVIEDDFDYLLWCIENVDLFFVSDEVEDLIELHIESVQEEPQWDDYDMTWHEGHPDNFGDSTIRARGRTPFG